MISIGLKYPYYLFLIILYLVVVFIKEKVYFFKYYIPMNISKKDKYKYKKTGSTLFILTFLLVLSISAPEIEIYRHEKRQKKVASFVFDLTFTMNSSFIDKNRIKVSKEIAEHIIKIDSESSFSIVSFTEKVEIESPLTPDKEYLVNRIKKLKTSATDVGSPFIDSIFSAVRTLNSSKKKKLIIIFTDCENDISSLERKKIIKLLEKEKIAVFIVTFSDEGKKLIPVETPSGTVLIEKSLKTDEVFLEKIALTSSGGYFKLKTEEDVNMIKKFLEDKIFKKASEKEVVKKVKLNYYILILFFLVLIKFAKKSWIEK